MLDESRKRWLLNLVHSIIKNGGFSISLSGKQNDRKYKLVQRSSYTTRITVNVFMVHGNIDMVIVRRNDKGIVIDNNSSNRKFMNKIKCALDVRFEKIQNKKFDEMFDEYDGVMETRNTTIDKVLGNGDD